MSKALLQEEVEATANKQIKIVINIVDLDPDLDLGLAHFHSIHESEIN